MNTIIAYLETMFGTYPQTPKLLEAKAELRTMMDDAYQAFHRGRNVRKRGHRRCHLRVWQH